MFALGQTGAQDNLIVNHQASLEERLRAECLEDKNFYVELDHIGGGRAERFLSLENLA